MKVRNLPNVVPVIMFTDGVDVDEGALQQVDNIATLPFVKDIAVMPDTHQGLGGPIGVVVATKKALIPSVCGVDIGCGMLAAKTSLTAKDLPDNLNELYENIMKAVPAGRTNRGGAGDRGAWHNIPGMVISSWGTHLGIEYEEIVEKYPKIAGRGMNNINHLGTLGTGNHFNIVMMTINYFFFQSKFRNT